MAVDIPETTAKEDRIEPARQLSSIGWLVPFLFILAAVAEILAMLLMTIYRYANQGLEATLLDLSKTADLLGLLLAAPFILLFVALSMMPRFRRAGIATAAAAMASISIVALSIMPWVPDTDQAYAYAGYLAWKILEMAIMVVVLRTPDRPFWRKSLSVAILTAVTMVGGFIVVISAVLLSPISSTIIEHPRQEFDAAVILGAAVWSGNRPSPVLRQRIKRGHELLKNGTVQFLVLTGSNAPYELPEAEVARRELLKLGVDPTRIVIETHTHSTVEQILFIRDQLMTTQHWSSFIIVSDQFHLKRALEICQFNGIDARGVSSESPLGPQNLWIYHIRESAALILYWMFGI